jgi:lysozyme family protein
MPSLAEEAIKRVLAHEGGFGADPRDPGNWTKGEQGLGDLKGTNFGISAAQYPTLDIEHLTESQAIQIYRREYWDACRCDDLPPALAVMVFDAAVQHGAGNRQDDSPAMLQRAIGSIPDGKIGPKTIEAAQKIDTKKALRNLFVERAIHYSNNRNWTIYKQGWMKRLGDVMIYAASFLD